VSTSAALNRGLSPESLRRLPCMSNSDNSSASITTDTGFFLRSSLSHTHTRSPGCTCPSRPHHPPTLTSVSASTGHVSPSFPPSISRVTVWAFASAAFTWANGFGSRRRTSAVPATSFAFLFASAGGGAESAYTFVPGYSAAQANHFTCTLSTHSSV